MEQIKIYDYYSFGYNYCILLKGDLNKTNLECFKDIEKYIKFIVDLNLHVTISCIHIVGLYSDMEKLQKLARSNKTKNLKVDKAFWNGFIEKIKRVDSTLDAELNTKTAYLLDNKRYTNEILLNKIHQLFSPNTFNFMPPIAQYDFEESGKCLAFDRYTACSFHALRGTEDVLKMYYEKLFTSTTTNNETWGTYETAIKNAISTGTLNPAPDEQLIINIGSLRKFYRNKTQHPQNTYSCDETQDLLSLCIKTVNEIAADLKKRGIN